MSDGIKQKKGDDLICAECKCSFSEAWLMDNHTCHTNPPVQKPKSTSRRSQ